MKTLIREAFGSSVATPDRIGKWIAAQGVYSLIAVKPVYLDKEIVQDAYRDCDSLVRFISPSGYVIKDKCEDYLPTQLFTLILALDDDE